MYADVLGDVGMMSFSSMISMPMMFVVLIGAPILAKKISLEKMIRYSLLLGSAMFGGLFVMHLVMEVPAFVHMIISSLALSFAMVSIQMQWGLVAEVSTTTSWSPASALKALSTAPSIWHARIGQTVGNSAAVLALGWIGYDSIAAAQGLAQSASTLTGIKVLCVLVPAIFALGSWAVFKFVWNITPEVRAKLAAMKSTGANS